MMSRKTDSAWLYVIALGVGLALFAAAGARFVIRRTLEEADRLPAAVVASQNAEQAATYSKLADLDFEVELRLNPKDELDYARVPAGEFVMGCVPGDGDCTADERPSHLVRIARPFWIGSTEVTVEAYRRFAGETGRSMPAAPDFNPDWGASDHPVVNITWTDAVAYCRWAGGRLPSEAEWEYAARGGRRGSRFPWNGHDEGATANLRGVGGADIWKGTSAVASFGPNGFGMYDAAGNAWEWVQDEWHDDYVGAPADGSAWGAPLTTAPGEKAAVLRGGSCFHKARQARCSYRSRFFWPGDRFDDYGFRCVLELKNTP